MPEETADPYYLKRAGRWPIGNTGGEGGKLIASKRRLSRHAERDHARLDRRMGTKAAPRANAGAGGAESKIVTAGSIGRSGSPNSLTG